jgi:hypothetical protein
LFTYLDTVWVDSVDDRNMSCRIGAGRSDDDHVPRHGYIAVSVAVLLHTDGWGSVEDLICVADTERPVVPASGGVQALCQLHALPLDADIGPVEVVRPAAAERRRSVGKDVDALSTEPILASDKERPKRRTSLCRLRGEHDSHQKESRYQRCQPARDHDYRRIASSQPKPPRMSRVMGGGTLPVQLQGCLLPKRADLLGSVPEAPDHAMRGFSLITLRQSLS